MGCGGGIVSVWGVAGGGRQAHGHALQYSTCEQAPDVAAAWCFM